MLRRSREGLQEGLCRLQAEEVVGVDRTHWKMMRDEELPLRWKAREAFGKKRAEKRHRDRSRFFQKSAVRTGWASVSRGLCGESTL